MIKKGKEETRHPILPPFFDINYETVEVRTLAGNPDNPGFRVGYGQRASFCFPQGLCVNDNKHLFVADTWNHVIRHVKPTGAETFTSPPLPIKKGIN